MFVVLVIDTEHAPQKTSAYQASKTENNRPWHTFTLLRCVDIFFYKVFDDQHNLISIIRLMQ